MSVGTTIVVSGCTETAYNGNFTVATAPTSLTFTYTALSVPSAAPATGFPINISPNTWYGSANRLGLFDSQNGMFFEYDGQTLYAVRRNSTQQLSGSVTATLGSASVIGVATKFSSQLKPGDSIVIRGMTYFVQAITSDTQLFIYPEYRGVTAANCLTSKTIDTRVAQSQWNIDPCNGTGASLYNMDLTKMQMFYIDYSWYGAGAVRYGFKNNRGEVIYCHRSPNNNINTEAYMRSGNLVGRYETNTLPIRTFLTATLTSGVTASVSVSDTSLFPPTGTILLAQAANTGGVIEYISYTGKTATTFTGLTRNVAGGTASATTFTFSATAPILVESYSPAEASTISHWGSSVIMDGRFDNDKSFVFNAGMNTAVANIPAGARAALISLRLAPSVDNGLTGLLGFREIINRMQLTLSSMGVITTGSNFRLELILNGRITGGTFAAVGGSSLSQIAFHQLNTTLTPVAIADTAGTLTVPSGNYSIGQPITISGTFSAGSITGYSTPRTYFIGRVNSATSVQICSTLADAINSVPVFVVSTAGTITPGATVTLNTSTVYGGESIFGFFAASNNVTSQNLDVVRDLGTSILGGGTSLLVPNSLNNIYPDGPDVVTLVATNISASATNTINARISWSEAQA